jgi:hypothetical protein
MKIFVQIIEDLNGERVGIFKELTIIPFYYSTGTNNGFRRKNLLIIEKKYI